MEEHGLLACSSCLSQPSFLKHTGPEAHHWYIELGLYPSIINQEEILRTLPESKVVGQFPQSVEVSSSQISLVCV